MKRCKNANDYRAEIKRLTTDLAAMETLARTSGSKQMHAERDLSDMRSERNDLLKQRDGYFDELTRARLTIARLEGYVARVIQVDQSTETRAEGTVFGIPCDNGSQHITQLEEMIDEKSRGTDGQTKTVEQKTHRFTGR